MSDTPRTSKLFDQELGRIVALDPHFKYYQRVRQEMEAIERDLALALAAVRSAMRIMTYEQKRTFEDANSAIIAKAKP